jgi:peptide/nickel transport system substrate-binding protein
MMPARIAATSPDEQLKEVVGSGPFKFAKDEWQPGHQAVYVRNSAYVPRHEPPSGSTGGKQAHLDRVVWRYMPDHAVAAEALAGGDVDWWESPPLDFIPKIEQNPALRTFLFDSQGVQGWLRPNHLHPPFNNRKARQALLHMMDQVTYLSWAIGQAKYYRPCYSVFACSGPYATQAGAEPMMKHDIDRARQLVKESGYDGRPVVLIHVTDNPYLIGAGPVTRARLESIGFRVEYQAMDWANALVARTRKEPPDRGGWNILHTWWPATTVINPAVHFGISGAGAAAWFGWPDVPRLDKLTTDWVRATDQARRKQVAEEIQKVALDEVVFVPWGEWFAPTAFLKDVHGILKFAAPVFWNVRIG